jgi:hypothetical protein
MSAASGVYAQMPRFHLNIRNGHGFTPDEQGQELPGPEAARAAAVDGARDLMCADLMLGELDLRGQIEITDASGQLIDTVRFGDLVAVRTPEPER